jgi:hypothetical protein
MRRKLLGDAHPGTADALDRLARILILEGKYDEAESLLLDACSRMATAPKADPVIQSNLFARLAGLYTKSGKPAQAVEWKNRLARLPQTQTGAGEPAQ